MLFLVGAWLLLIAVGGAVGRAVLQAVRGERAFDRLADRLIVSVWLGMLAFGAALQGLSLFFPLSAAVGAVLAAVALVGALSVAAVREDARRLRSAASGPLVAGFLTLALGAAAFVAQRVIWTDTGLYHAGAIRWLSEFGAVPGIALIHSRFGFSSLWFALAAPFNEGGMREHAAAVIGGFALLLATCHAAVALGRALGRRARESDWVVLFGSAFVLPIVVWWKVPVSPNPDLALNVLPVVVAWALVTVSAAGSAVNRSPAPLLNARIIPFLLAAGAVAIKLSGAPLLVVAGLFYLLTPTPRARRLIPAVLLGAAVLGPSMVTGFVASGCPLYPGPPCLDAPWSVGWETASGESRGIRDYTRWRTAVSEERASSLGWVRSWLENPQHLLMLATGALGLIAAPRAPPEQRWLLALGFAGLALVLYSAPDLRFALGYSGILAAVFCTAYRDAWARAAGRAPLPVTRRAMTGAVGVAVLMAVGGFGLAAARLLRPTTGGPGAINEIALVIPPRMNAAAELPRQRVNGIDYLVPPDGLCWTASLPCTQSGFIRRDVVLRDPRRGIEGGFERR